MRLGRWFQVGNLQKGGIYINYACFAQGKYQGMDQTSLWMFQTRPSVLQGEEAYVNALGRSNSEAKAST